MWKSTSRHKVRYTLFQTWSILIINAWIKNRRELWFFYILQTHRRLVHTRVLLNSINLMSSIPLIQRSATVNYLSSMSRSSWVRSRITSRSSRGQLFQITERYHWYLSREGYTGVRKISIFTTRRSKNILLPVALLFFARSEITLGVFFLCKVRIVVGGKRSCFLRLAEFTPSIFHRVRRCVYTTEGDYYHSSSLV